MSSVFTESFNIVMRGVSAVWSWFDQLMDALPGAFAFILVGIFLFMLFRILMGRLVSFNVSSDTAVDRSGRVMERTSRSFKAGNFSRTTRTSRKWADWYD